MSRTVRPEVATFVAQVRACLSDLAPEEVEELTGGLDADLEERLEDTAPGTPPPDLGDPVAYAAELRAAAGLPPRGAAGVRPDGPGGLVRFLRGLRDDLEPFADAVRRQPWWPEFRASVVALLPAWWLARGWVAWWLVTDVASGRSRLLPAGIGGLLLLLVCVGVSVALGRGLLDRPLRLERSWSGPVLFALNVLALVLLMPALGSVGSGGVPVYDPPTAGGLVLDGNPVTNVFAYDAQGRPIPVVQLYDQDGRPLAVDHSEYEDGSVRVFDDGRGGQVAPWVDDRGQGRWNVFPLPAASYASPTYDENGTQVPVPAPVVSAPVPPLVAVPPITGILGVPSSAPTATTPSVSVTPTPTTTGPDAAPAPSGSASGAPSGSPSGSPTRTAP